MKIVRNNIAIGKWYHGQTLIPQAYCNDKLVFPNIYSDVEEGYDVMCSGTINDYEGTAPEVYVMSVSKWYMRTTGGNYKEYGVYGDNKNDPYVGELVVVDGHEWEYTSSGWVDLGEAGQTSDYEEYEELEILQTKRAALYDIGYNSSTDISKIWCKYYLTKHSGDISIAQNGAYSLSAGMAINYFGSINHVGGNYFISGSDRHTNYWLYFSGNSDAEFEYDRDAHTITFNGNTKTFTAEPTGAATGYTLKIFSPIRNTNPYTINAGDKIYGYKVWNNGTLAVDLVPALRKSDNAMGLYDKVRDMFFTNSAFSVQLNNKVSPSSSMYTKYEYIQGNGTSYIKTDYYPKSNSAVEIDIEGRTNTSSSNDKFPFGTDYTNPPSPNNLRWKIIYINGYTRFDYGGTNYQTSDSGFNSRGIVRMDSNGGYLDGVQKVSFSGTFDPPQCPCGIFAPIVHNYSTGEETITSGRVYDKKIYSVKIYEGDTLVREYVPAIKDNVVGMYDTVNGVMYSSYNSTPFTVGGEHEDVGGLVKEYDEKDAPDPIGSGYYTSPDEFLKNNDNYYKKDYVIEIYEGGCEIITTEYVQGAQLTPSYVQGQESDFIVYDGGRYYKNYIYVTPVSTPIATGDYVRGEYIGPADIIISGVTKSSSNFTVKINNTNTTANIISTSGSNYNYAVYGSFNDSISISGLVYANTNIITCNVITSGVTSVNGNAFRGCTSLENVTLPDSITSIDGYSFTDCISLKSFVVPSGVTSLSNEVFAGCSALTSVTFHNNFMGLGYMAFSYCKNLTSITLPDSITSIGDAVFYGAGLTSIHIPASVTSINSKAFENCSGITSMTVDANNTTFDSRDNCNAIIKKSNNQLNNGCMNTVIPSTVTSIASRAFSGHMNLAIITIPSGVTEIGSYAFYNCRNTLFHIESETPATLSSYAFDNGYGYILVPVGTSATYKGATNWSRYASRIYEEGTDFSTAQVKGVANKGQTWLCFNGDMGSKYYCAITSVNQDDTVNFVWDSGMTVNRIGSNSMNSDYRMSQNIITVDFRNLPNTCTGITPEAFYSYPYKEIYLPSSITSVGKRAFQYYGGKVHFTSSTPPTIDSTSFYDAYCIIYVPVGTAETYKAASNWTQYSRMIFEEGTDFSTMPVTGTANGGNVTMRFGSSDLRGAYYDGDKFFINAPLTATTIGGINASSNITTIDLSRMTNATSIGNNTFNGNHSLTTAKLPDSLTSINYCGFYDCTALQSITIPSGVTSLDFGAFFNDGNSNTVYIFEPVTPPTLGSYVFWQAKGTIYVPDESLTAYKTATNWIEYASKIKPISELPSE